MRARFLLEEGLPVGERDLVIIRMDLGEGQEAVPVAAVFDESGLQRRFDPGYLREVDIAAKLLLVSRLEIEFFYAITFEHHHPGFFRVGRIDEHFAGHGWLCSQGGASWRSPCRPTVQDRS